MWCVYSVKLLKKSVYSSAFQVWVWVYLKWQWGLFKDITNDHATKIVFC